MEDMNGRKWIGTAAEGSVGQPVRCSGDTPESSRPSEAADQHSRVVQTGARIDHVLVAEDNEINQMVVQVTKSFQGIMPGSQETTYEQRKLTMILTGEELESFNMKPYPNQIYEMVISDQALSFKQV